MEKAINDINSGGKSTNLPFSLVLTIVLAYLVKANIIQL